MRFHGYSLGLLLERLPRDPSLRGDYMFVLSSQSSKAYPFKGEEGPLPTLFLVSGT